MAEGRPVRGVVRTVDPVSVARVAGLFYVSFVIVVLLAGVILWFAARALGVIDDFERSLGSIGFDDFHFVGAQMLRGLVAMGAVVAVLGTGLTVLAAVLFNLISDLVGGVRLTVVEDDRGQRSG